MNPDRHLTSHYDYFLDLVRGDDDSAEAHRKFYDEYNAVLDMPAEYYLDTIKTVFQDFALVNGTWEVDGPGAPAGHHDHRPADRRRRAGRHLRRRPDPGRARPVRRHAQAAPVPLRRQAPATTASSRPPLARERLPAGARLHRQVRGGAAEATAKAAPKATARPAPARKRKA
jgi:hypothetical protein